KASRRASSAAKRFSAVCAVSVIGSAPDVGGAVAATIAQSVMAETALFPVGGIVPARARPRGHTGSGIGSGSVSRSTEAPAGGRLIPVRTSTAPKSAATRYITTEYTAAGTASSTLPSTPIAVVMATVVLWMPISIAAAVEAGPVTPNARGAAKPI